MDIAVSLFSRNVKPRTYLFYVRMCALCFVCELCISVCIITHANGPVLIREKPLPRCQPLFEKLQKPKQGTSIKLLINVLLRIPRTYERAKHAQYYMYVCVHTRTGFLETRKKRRKDHTVDYGYRAGEILVICSIRCTYIINMYIHGKYT